MRTSRTHHSRPSQEPCISMASASACHNHRASVHVHPDGFSPGQIVLARRAAALRIHASVCCPAPTPGAICGVGLLLVRLRRRWARECLPGGIPRRAPTGARACAPWTAAWRARGTRRRCAAPWRGRCWRGRAPSRRPGQGEGWGQGFRSGSGFGLGLGLGLEVGFGFGLGLGLGLA